MDVLWPKPEQSEQEDKEETQGQSILARDDLFYSGSPASGAGRFLPGVAAFALLLWLRDSLPENPFAFIGRNGFLLLTTQGLWMLWAWISPDHSHWPLKYGTREQDQNPRTGSEDVCARPAWLGSLGHILPLLYASTDCSQVAQGKWVGLGDRQNWL